MPVSTLVYTVLVKEMPEAVFCTLGSCRISEQQFCSWSQRTTPKTPPFQTVLARRTARSLSNGHEDPVLEHFILNEILLCFADLGRK